MQKIKHLLAIFAISILSNALGGESPRDIAIRRKIAQLKSDRITWNCFEGMNFLAQHSRNPSVQRELRAHLSTTDDQQREAILILLCRAKAYTPDRDFIEAVLDRMAIYGRPRRFSWSEPAGDAGADFLISHAKQHGPRIASRISDEFKIDDNSLWFQYAIARSLAKAHVIHNFANSYSPKFMTRLAAQLRSDEIPNNAQLATMTFLFLGDLGKPTLRVISRRGDEQARQLSTLILSFLDKRISIDELDSAVGRFDFIGFDPGDLRDCDVNKSVVGLRFFRFKPGISW